MKNFTNEQITNLMEQAQKIVSGVSEGEETREIMARLYVENLEDKTTEQGLAMADRILAAVNKFDVDYTCARDNVDGFIKAFQDKVEEGKSTVERCNYWLKLTAAISAAGEELTQGTLDREKLAAKLDALQVSEEEATEERAKQLREQAFEALKNSGVLLSGLKDLETELANVSTADEAAELLIDLGGRKVEYRAIMAMLAYTQVKTGQVDNVPVEMTAEQITVAVCAGVEQVRIAEGVENGSIVVDVAAALLAILGTLVVIDFLMSVFIAGVVTAFVFFPTLLAIPACVMLAIGLFRAGAKMVKSWTQDSRNIVRSAVKAVKVVFNGIKTLVSFLWNKVVPAALELGRKLWARLTNKSEETVNGEDEVVVVENAFTSVLAVCNN